MPLIAAIFGLAPLEHALDTQAEPAAMRAAACGECHEAQYEDWSASRHASAHSNSIYQAGLAAEPQPFCVRCHAPLREQGAEVLRNLDWYQSWGPHAEPGPAPAFEAEDFAHEGVTCATCHLRGGTILTPTDTHALHPTRAAPLRDPELCAVCHEFPFVAEGKYPTSALMQSTFSEWRAWGGAETCQTCHMPEGRHLFRGAHDQAWLRQSVSVEVGRGTWTLRSVGVGHSLPTGDLFRHLTFEVERGGKWQVKAWIGRTFRTVREGGLLTRVLDEDTSLKPGVPLVVRGAPGRWRLVYHYGSATDEARGLVPIDDLVVILAEG